MTTPGDGAAKQYKNPLEKEEVDIFKRLLEYIRLNNTRAVEIFNTFDKDRSGYLVKEELHKLVLKMCPEASAADVDYFQAMVDVREPYGRINYSDFYSALKDCQSVGADVSNGGTASRQAIEKLQAELKKYNYDAKKAFGQYDTSGAGVLEFADIGIMVQHLMGGLGSITPAERRYVISNIKHMVGEGYEVSGGITFEELQNGLEPEWMKHQKGVRKKVIFNAKTTKKDDLKTKIRQNRIQINKQRERAAWAQNVRERNEEDRKHLQQEDLHRRKMDHSARLKDRNRMRVEAAGIAIAMKEQHELHENYRQIERQDAAAQRAREEFGTYYNEMVRQREKQREEFQKEDRGLSEKVAASSLQTNIKAKFKYRPGQRFINIVEFADPQAADSERRSVGGSVSCSSLSVSPVKARPGTAPASSHKAKEKDPPPTKTVWAGVKVVDFECAPPSKYSMLPATKRYEYYRKYGFAGKGAKTSWAHNPTKKPVRLPCHSFWPDTQDQEDDLVIQELCLSP